MGFLAAFTDEHRRLFEGAAVQVDLDAGQWLIRRGEPGGDLYYLIDGILEIVDTRSMPQIILTTLDAGAVVGEMAFVDESPRSADVRAGAACTVLRWARDDLKGLVERHPDFASSFYEQIARWASTRIRFLTEGAVQGVFATETGPVADAEDITAWAMRIADTAKRSLPGLEARLRNDPSDTEAAGGVHQLMDIVQDEVSQLFDAHRDAASGTLAAEVLGRELHPWLVRSSLAERCLRRPVGGSGTAEILAHVLVDTAGGEGPLGEALDRWLLNLPTFRALRAMRGPLVDRVQRLLPDHRNRHVLCLNAGTGSLVARLAERLGQPPTVLTVLDQSRDALTFIDAGVVTKPSGVELRPLQDSLAQVAMGRMRHTLPPQDAVVVHGLLEYLPERLAVSLLDTIRGMLTPEGVIVLATLAPSADRIMLDRVLGWPTIRRDRRAVLDLLGSAHLDAHDAPGPSEPTAVLASAAIDERTLLRTPRRPIAE